MLGGPLPSYSLVEQRSMASLLQHTCAHFARQHAVEMARREAAQRAAEATAAVAAMPGQTAAAVQAAALPVFTPAYAHRQRLLARVAAVGTTNSGGTYLGGGIGGGFGHGLSSSPMRGGNGFRGKDELSVHRTARTPLIQALLSGE